ncbi:hypothetical protein phiGM223_01 [Pseudomonas phage phiGM22-3]|uniref:Uncharacterized protein n=1 Tax=Pseudomonas phage phiGM22-3 TaxID=2816462 RepID=A0A8T8IV13_9CAUD|nr:hypothetical protein phiGM223_01 [Pseudomonas phage phiGM22-3]
MLVQRCRMAGRRDGEAQATNLPGFSTQAHHEVGLWGRMGVIRVGGHHARTATL